MMSFAEFEAQFGATYETFHFYTNTDSPVELKFDKVKHEYFRVDPDTGELILLLSGSKVGHIVDKSMALVPWSCKMMSQKIFATVPMTKTKSGVEAVIMPYADFEKAVMAAKTAHKDKLEDAGDVGHATHDWIERYIQALIDQDAARAALLLETLPLDERAANGC